MMKHLGVRLAIVGVLGITCASCIHDDSETCLASVSDQITSEFVSVIDQPGGAVVFSTPYTLTSSQFNGVPPYSFTWLRNGTVMPECPNSSSCTFWPPVPMLGDWMTLTVQDAT